jgi:hypothetical protein
MLCASRAVCIKSGVPLAPLASMMLCASTAGCRWHPHTCIILSVLGFPVSADVGDIDLEPEIYRLICVGADRIVSAVAPCSGGWGLRAALTHAEQSRGSCLC